MRALAPVISHVVQLAKIETNVDELLKVELFE